MSDIKLNNTQAAVLAILHQGEATAGQIMAIVDKWVGPYWSMTRSQVYRELLILTEAQYVKPGTPGERGMVPYTILASGRSAFKAWAETPPKLDAIRNQTVLRLAFSGVLDDSQLVEIIEGVIARHQEAAFDVRASITEADKEGNISDVWGLEFAWRYHQMCIQYFQDMQRRWI